MTDLILHAFALPTFVIALVVFGFAPGAVLRVITLIYPKDDPRRRELQGELYACPRIERPFWVMEQLELALFEGVSQRIRAIGEVRGTKAGAKILLHLLLLGNEQIAISDRYVFFPVGQDRFRSIDHTTATLALKRLVSSPSFFEEDEEFRNQVYTFLENAERVIPPPI